MYPIQYVVQHLAPIGTRDLKKENSKTLESMDM
jgi:hypothetical protein